MIYVVLIVILLLLVALPKILETLRKPISAADHKSAPGDIAYLSKGATHYQWLGPVRGPVAVLIHGLTTPSVVWKDVAQGLGDSGYRVLVYDLYGRGFSDAPKGNQDTTFFLTQLDELLTDQELTDDLTLVGYSMGGAIATAFAANEPHRMKRLILLAPSGIETKESEFSRFCRMKPVLGDWLHGAIAGFRMRSTIARDLAAGASPDVIEAQKRELKRRGFLPAVLSSRRNMLEAVQENEHRSISRDGIPVIAIWGEQDSVIPISSVGKMAQWNRMAHQEVVQGAGHALPYSHGSQVTSFLRDMLRSN